MQLISVQAEECSYAAHRAQLEPVTLKDIALTGDIHLQDGRILRLIGVVWPAQEVARARIELQKQLMLHLKAERLFLKANGEPDRWGRIPALLYVQEIGATYEPFLLQAGLLEAGLVPYWPERELAGCIARFQTFESAAYRAKRGIWQEGGVGAISYIYSHSSAAPLSQQQGAGAQEASQETKLEGRLGFMRGKLVSQFQGRRKVFYRLGRGRRHAMGGQSFAISARKLPLFAKAGLSFEELQGKSLLLRGLIAGRTRPYLDISDPNQIQILDE